MWVTIYFKSGAVTETLIHSFGELDVRYKIDDIMQIDIGCTMLDENREKQQELLKLKINLSRAEDERLGNKCIPLDTIEETIFDEF